MARTSARSLRTAGAAAAIAGLVLAGTGPALAQTAPAAGTGTARTAASAVELRSTGLPALGVVGDDGAVDLLVGQLATLATTDPTLDVNPVDAPFAAAGIIPLQLDDTALGQAEVRSDGTSSATVAEQAVGDLAGSDAVAGATGVVELLATAGADSARATISALTGQVRALLGTLGLDVDVTAAESVVDATSARSSQGLTVTGIDLQLGDLVPADVLASLPLGAVLDLLDATGLPLPDGLATALAELRAGVDDVDGAATDLVAAADAVTDGAELLADLTGQLGTAQSQQSTLQQRSADLTAQLGTLPAGSQRDGVQADLDTVTAQLTTVGATIDDLLGRVDDAADQLPVDVAALDDALAALRAALDDLGLVIPGLDTDLSALLSGLDDLAGASLLAVEGLTIGTSAVAADTLDASSATLVCSSATVTLVGTALPPLPSCDQGVDAIRAAVAQVPADLAPVADVLGALPLDAPIGDLRLELFGVAEREVTQSGSTITSNAHLEVLRLQVPSLSIAPCDAVAQLCELGLPDLEGLVGDALGAATTATSTAQSALTGAGLGDLAAPLAALEDLGTRLTDLQALLVTLDAVVDDLDLGALGSLTEGVTTPSLTLVVDPESSAAFTAAAGTSSAPPLPATGGGAALLGIVAVAAGAALRRRTTA